MTGQGHYLEVVVSGQAEIVQGTMAKIMKDKILNTGHLTSRPEGPLDFVKGLPVEQKDAVRMQGAR